MPALRFAHLTKQFAPGRGVIDLDLEVAVGSIFGFLGPNGAGKTTAIRCLLDYLRPDAGQATVLGLDVRTQAMAIRRRIGYVPAEYRLYEQETGRALIAHWARYRDAGSLARAEGLVERLGLDPSGRVKHYSKGMKQKLALVQALMHDPELLILDEPSDALDPLVQADLHALLREVRAQGRTVFFSSHRLSEVEQLCDRVAIVNRGRLVANEEVGALRAKAVKRLTLEFEQPVDPVSVTVPAATLLSSDGYRLTYACASPPRELLAAIADLPLRDFTLEAGRLEDIFLTYYPGAQA